jgi:hypothetical protein
MYLTVSNFGANEVVMNTAGAENITGLQLSYPPGMMGLALDAIEEKIPMDMRVDGAPFVAITMPCGEIFTVWKREEFPIVDVPCRCGDKNHFFIKHEIKKGEEE